MEMFNDIKLVRVTSDNDGDGCFVFPKNMPCIGVQVDNLEDAPKKLGKMFEAILKYGLKKGEYDTIHIPSKNLK